MVLPPPVVPTKAVGAAPAEAITYGFNSIEFAVEEVSPFKFVEFALTVMTPFESVLPPRTNLVAEMLQPPFNADDTSSPGAFCTVSVTTVRQLEPARITSDTRARTV